MTEFHSIHFLILVSMVIVSWSLPKSFQMIGLTLFSNAALLFISPISFLCLMSSSLSVYWVSKYKSHHPVWVTSVIVYCLAQFLILREFQNIFDWGFLSVTSILGLAYFTCRHIHYAFESYKGCIQHNLYHYWMYQSFFPTLVAGPINQYADFIKNIQRRHFSNENFSLAIERVIYGYAKVVILGNYIINDKLKLAIEVYQHDTFQYMWLSSALDWAYLYMQFSGWSDIAIGFALLMGVKIKENFNHPYKALNIIDFWQRWHISLSLWCKEYVFMPLLAATRQPFLAILGAMIAMGIWHESSWYYLLWAFYHASGIAICRLFQNKKPMSDHIFWQSYYWKLVSWLLTMNFIICGSLVISPINVWLIHHV